MRTKHFYFLAVLFFVLSCKPKESKTIQPKYSLQGQTMICEEFNGKAFLGKKDSDIVMYSYSDTLFEIYKLRDHNIERTNGFVTKGNGPNEYNIFAAYFDNKSSNFYILENNGKLTHGNIININDKHTLEDSKTWTNIDLTWIKSFYAGFSFIPLTNDTILMIGGVLKSQHLLSKILISQKTIIPVDYWIKDKYANGNNLVSQRIYMDNAYLFKNDVNQKFVYSGGYGKVVFIFELKENKAVSIIKIYDEVNRYTTQDGLNYVFPNKTAWDLQTKVTNKYIYIRTYKLENEKGKLKEYKGYPSYYSDNLEIYDWNGKHITDINLDTPFYDFIIDEDNKFILTLTDDSKTGETIMRRYSLGNIVELK